MSYLRKVKILVPLMVLYISGCATPGYRILFSDTSAAEIMIGPDRILLECEWLHDADRKDLYGFMIHVLDENNTVLSVSQGNTLDKESCMNRLNKIGKIISKGNRIYVAGTGNLKRPTEKTDLKYTFPKIGIFNSNGRALQFVAIANEHGDCFDAYDGDTKPCPQEPFPLFNKK